MWTCLLRIAALADVLDGPAPCSRAPLDEICHDGQCHPDNSLCPPVTTEPSCGEWPHSGRDGAVLTWGLSYRASSAQACCDKCKSHPRKCNSWTFCPLTVCWGLDTGHNHTFGGVHAVSGVQTRPGERADAHLSGSNRARAECWLRRLKDVQADSQWRQRGKYTDDWLSRHRRARGGCKRNERWACSPTHVPWTSGAIGGPVYDPALKHVTGGGWGSVWTSPVEAVVG